jgi:hypothetical protein
MRRKDFAPCPDCGGPMSEGSRRCQACYGLMRVGRPGNSGRAGVYSEEAVHTVGRRESIITFREEETGEVVTRHCFGPTVPEQVSNGLLGILKPGKWVVEYRSTPASILLDLRGRPGVGKGNGMRKRAA